MKRNVYLIELAPSWYALPKRLLWCIQKRRLRRKRYFIEQMDLTNRVDPGKALGVLGRDSCGVGRIEGSITARFDSKVLYEEYVRQAKEPLVLYFAE